MPSLPGCIYFGLHRWVELAGLFRVVLLYCGVDHFAIVCMTERTEDVSFSPDRSFVKVRRVDEHKSRNFAREYACKRSNKRATPRMPNEDVRWTGDLSRNDMENSRDMLGRGSNAIRLRPIHPWPTVCHRRN